MPTSEVMQQIDAACRCIATGRLMARSLSRMLRDCDLGEAEFRFMWLLESLSAQQPRMTCDQKQLAERLGLSPAQVSALVERLQSMGVISTCSSRKDRRKQHWEINEKGQEVLARIVQLLSNSAELSTMSQLSNPSYIGRAA